MREAVVTLAIRVAGAGLAFAMQALLARQMSVGDYGSYVMVWTWILSLGSFASLGLAEVAMRLLPRYAQRLRMQAVRGFFGYGFRTTAMAAGAMSSVALAITLFLPVSAEQRLVILGVCCGLPFLALEFFLEGVARAMGWYRLTTVTIYIIRPLMIIAVLLAAVLSGTAVTGAFAIALLVGCVIATTLALRLIMQRSLATATGRAPSHVGLQRFWSKQTRSMLAVSGLDDLLNYADVVLVGLLMSPAQSAVYFVASRVLTLANLAQYAFYFVAARRFSQSVAAKDTARARDQMWQATGLTVLTTAIAIVVTLAVSPWLLALFGDAYVDQTHVVVIMGLAMLARSVGVQPTELMIVTGRMQALMAVNAATAAGLVVGLAAIVPVAGVIGAAATVATTMFARSLMLIALQMRPVPVTG